MTDRLSASLLKDPVHALALGFGAGLVPKAPGTAGSALALLPAWWMLGWPLAPRLAVVAVLLGLGIVICGASARRLGRHDHPAIVLDEIVGLLAAVLVLPAEPLWLVPAFLLFRLFDIVKPWPIRDVDHRLAGGAGIMLDDIMAAAYAALCLELLQILLSFA